MKSSDLTPHERLFRSFYIGLQRRWNETELNALCHKLNYTPYELGALVGMKRGEVKRGIRNNRFALPVCRHFHNLSRWGDLKRGIKLEHDPMDLFLR